MSVTIVGPTKTNTVLYGDLKIGEAFIWKSGDTQFLGVKPNTGYPVDLNDGCVYGMNDTEEVLPVNIIIKYSFK